jgi:hypothetical protein
VQLHQLGLQMLDGARSGFSQSGDLQELPEVRVPGNVDKLRARLPVPKPAKGRCVAAGGTLNGLPAAPVGGWVAGWGGGEVLLQCCCQSSCGVVVRSCCNAVARAHERTDCACDACLGNADVLSYLIFHVYALRRRVMNQ